MHSLPFRPSIRPPRFALGHLPALDALRGLAIILVFLTHAVALPLNPAVMPDAAVRALARVGWSGVDLFFVLSGFLITGILFDTKAQPHYFRNFLGRRILRVFPLYYGFLALFFIVVPRLVPWEGAAFATLRANQAWYWAYGVNLLEAIKGGGATPLNTSHLWSLSIEEQFYLVWPLVVWASSPRTLVRIALVVVAGGLAFRTWWVLRGGDPVGAYLLTPGRLDGLMAGAFLAVAARRPEGLGAWRRLAWQTLIGCVAFLGCVAWWRGGFEYRDPVLAVIAYPGLAAAYGALLVIGVTTPPHSGVLSRIFAHPGLHSLGRYSYAIYVFHYPLLGLLEEKLPFVSTALATSRGSHLLAVVVLALVAAPMSFALAWLSYRVYERPFLALKRYF